MLSLRLDRTLWIATARESRMARGWPGANWNGKTHPLGWKNPLKRIGSLCGPCEVLKKMCVFFGKKIHALVDFQIWSLRKGKKRRSHPGWCRTTGKMFLPKDTGVVHSYMFQWVGGFGTSTSQVSATHGRRNKVAVEKPAPVGAKDAWKSSTPSTHIHSILFVCIVWFPWRKPLLKITRKLRLTQGWGKPDTKSMWRNQWTIYLRNLMELPWSWWFKTQETCDASPFWESLNAQNDGQQSCFGDVEVVEVWRGNI